MSNAQLPADVQLATAAISTANARMRQTQTLMAEAVVKIEELRREKEQLQTQVADLGKELLLTKQLCMRQAHEIRRLSK